MGLSLSLDRGDGDRVGRKMAECAIEDFAGRLIYR
jgi:hypothetical protein